MTAETPEHGLPRGARIQARLFGAPSLEIDGEAAHVGARKAFAVLALLLLDGRLARPQAAQVLWPEVEPGDARRNLRRELFRLRGLGLEVREAADDVLELAAVVEADALQLLRAATGAGGSHHPDLRAAWPTSLLEGYEDLAADEWLEWLERWRARLSLKREELLRSQLRMLQDDGDDATALALCRALLAGVPTDEGVAIEALAILRRAGDVLAAEMLYDEIVVALREQYDVAPAPALRTYMDALRREANPRLPPTHADLPGNRVDAAQHATATPFVPRPSAQRRVHEAWAAGRRVYLAGPPGIGKTRLAQACASEGGAWLFVACRQGDVEVPFASAVRVLRAIMDAAPRAVLPAWITRELAHLMPEFGAAAVVLATSDARTRLQAAIAAAAAILLRDNFDCVVIDDWHHGDCASLEVWDGLTSPRPGTQQDADSQVRWLVTYRSTELHALAADRMWQEVEAGGAVHLELGPLEAAEFDGLLRALDAPRSEPELGARLREASGGNPFFVIEMLRQLDISPDSFSADAALPVPASVQASIAARIQALGEVPRRMLEAAALLDDAFEPLLLREVIGVAAGAAARALERAEADGVIEAAPAGYRFCHDLVRQCVVASLSRARRQLLHIEIGERLANRRGLPGVIAAQFERGGEPARAVQFRLAAAAAALRVHALMDARMHLGFALADGPDAATEVDIQLALAQVLLRTSAATPTAATPTAAPPTTATPTTATPTTGSPTVDTALEAGAAAASRVQDPMHAARLRLRVQLAMARHWLDVGRLDAVDLLLQTLAIGLERADAELRIEALVLQADLLQRRAGEHLLALATLARAIVLCRQLPEAVPQLASLLEYKARVAQAAGEPADARADIDLAIALRESLAEPGDLAQALLFRASLQPESAVSLADLERAHALSLRCGHVPALRAALQALAAHARTAGDAAALARWSGEADAVAAER